MLSMVPKSPNGLIAKAWIVHYKLQRHFRQTKHLQDTLKSVHKNNTTVWNNKSLLANCQDTISLHW